MDGIAFKRQRREIIQRAGFKSKPLFKALEERNKQAFSCALSPCWTGSCVRRPPPASGLPWPEAQFPPKEKAEFPLIASAAIGK